MEKAIEDSTDRHTKLEKRGRVESDVDSRTMHTLEPASMIRQVHLEYRLVHIYTLFSAKVGVGYYSRTLLYMNHCTILCL